MKEMEEIKKPEIKTRELLALLETVEWESDYVFEFNGTSFYICIIDSDELKTAEAEGKLQEFGESAEIIKSTYIDGLDIYLFDTIPVEERKRVLFHEILEGNIRDQGFSSERAHGVALQEEEKIFGKRKSNETF